MPTDTDSRMQQLIAAFDFDAGILAGVALLILAAGLIGATRQAGAFHTAGRSVGPVFGGMAISSALLTAMPFLGLTGALFLLGSDGLSWLVGLAAGVVLMGVLIVPAFRASGAVTVPEFLALRFGGRLVPLLAALIVAGLCFALLAVQLAAIGQIAQTILGVPLPIAIGASAAVIAVVLAAGGARSAAWISAGLLIAILVACLGPLAMLSLAKHGNGIGPLAYGETLQQVQNLEFDMLGEGLADAGTFKPHLRPFLQIDFANTLALIVCLMAGTAALPHVAMRAAVTAGVRQSRMAMAWALLFTSAVLSAIPAYAALTKHEVYSLVAKGIAFADVPEAFARHDVRVHGVPFSLYTSVVEASRSADADTAAVAAALQRERPRDFAVWSDLKPQVKAVLLQTAKGAQGADTAQLFQQWRATVLPVAATAAGNKSGKLTHSAIVIPPAREAFFGFDLAGLPRGWVVLFAIGGILAATGTGIATAWAVAQAVGRDFAGGTAEHSTVAVRLAALALPAAAAAAAIWWPADLLAVTAWALSLAAAALFPVLVLGIWWSRMTRPAALVSMLAGAAVTLLYIGGTQVAPVPFFEATSALSDAGASAVKRVADLKTAAERASPETRDAAEAALVAYARGTPYKAGAANWYGIHSSAAAVFGLPLAFLLAILISLLTRRPPAETQDFVRAIRRPTAQPRAD